MLLILKAAIYKKYTPKSMGFILFFARDGGGGGAGVPWLVNS